MRSAVLKIGGDVLTTIDKIYISERVEYALGALDEAGLSKHNLSQIIGQEIGLALQHEREKQRNLLELLVSTRQAIDEYFDSRTAYTYRELVAARDEIAALSIR